MDVKSKLKILADAAKYDASCASSGSKRESKNKLGNTEGMGICHSYAPDGRCISLLKILYTNHCIYDCSYCVNRSSSKIKRAKFTVSEVVWLTVEFYKRNYIEGLFLSSGIVGTADETMEDMIEVCKRLRQIENFGGYIHLKAVAGASPDLVQKAGWFADRVSANIELPKESDLKKFAPAKSFDNIESTMGSLNTALLENKEDKKKLKRVPSFAPGGQSTQMIVGASGSTDRDIIDKADALYKTFKLRRVYYSAFSPIPDSDPSLPSSSPPLIREHRLYQADWLVRFYGFEAGELMTEQDGNLALDKDPKLAWALTHRDHFPIDINRAPRRDLLRIPGIGVKNVIRIMQARKHRNLTLHDLKKMHVAVKRAKFFILTADYNPFVHQIDSMLLETQVSPQYVQPSLFETA